MLLNKHLLAVKVGAGIDPAESETLEIFFRHKEKGPDRKRRVCGEVEPHQRIVKGIADEFIELVVLLVLYLVLAAGPDRLDRVDRLAFELDRKRDKIGVLGNDAFDGLLFGIFLGIVFQFNNQPGAAVQARALGDGIAARGI